MPTYEYRCEACGHEFELFQSMSASPIRKCPECGKLKVKRLIGVGAGVIFKGSGFYETDYRSESYKKQENAERGTSSSGSDSSSETKTESKAETKSESKSGGGTEASAAPKASSDSAKGAGDSGGAKAKPDNGGAKGRKSKKKDS